MPQLEFIEFDEECLMKDKCIDLFNKTFGKSTSVNGFCHFDK